MVLKCRLRAFEREQQQSRIHFKEFKRCVKSQNISGWKGPMEGNVVQQPTQIWPDRSGCWGPCPVKFWIAAGVQSPQPLWVTCYSDQVHGKKVFPNVSRLFFPPTCVHCVLSYHWAQLRRVRYCALYALLSSSWRQQ